MAKRLMQEGHRPTLLAPINKVRKVKEVIPYVRDVECIDFSTGTSANLYYEDLNSIIAWLDRLPSLSKFDIVICDNLPEILSVRSDVVLSAQFFWHDVLLNINRDYFLFVSNLLKINEPIVIGCEYFSMQEVKKQKNYKPVKMYKNPQLVEYYRNNINKIKKNNLLISHGSTNILNIDNYIYDIEFNKYDTVYIDSDIIDKKVSHNVKSPDYSYSMYCSIKHAICRPGYGTIMDLLSVGVLPKSVYELGNSEMIHNSNVLNKYKYKLLEWDPHLS